MIQERLGVLVTTCAARKRLQLRTSAIHRGVCNERDLKDLGQLKGG